ncbi:MAG: CvpA family protein [Sphingomonadales bacterium]
MTALDMMVLLSLGIGGAFGAMRGFTQEVFLLAAWVAGITAVKLFYAPVTAFLTAPVGSAGGAAVLSTVLCFGIVFLATRLIGKSLGSAARGSLLGPIDRVLGLGFGALKGLLIATVAFLLMTLVYDFFHGANAARPEWMTKSRSYTLLRASGEAVVGTVEAARAR